MITYEFVNNYIRKTIKASDGILYELEKFAAENRIPIIQPEVARLISVMCSLIKPERVLEIGTAIGYSAILMAAFLKPGGRIDTIERNDLMVERARENIKRAGLSNVISVIAGDASDVLLNLDKKYDIVFVDAAKGQYLEFLPEIMRLLKKGGLLISDNVLYKGMVADDRLIVRRKKTLVVNMRNYLDTICRSEEFETSLLPVGDGVALSYRKYSSDEEREKD